MKQKKQSTVNQVLINLLVVVIFLVIVASLGGFVYVLCRDKKVWDATSEKKAQLQKDVDQLREEDASVANNTTRAKTSPHYVERLARERHQVAEGEVLYIFDDKEKDK